jgi:hypothetical protein
MTTLSTTASFRPLRSLLALAAAAAAFGAQALPVSVSIGGLPPGLTVQVDVKRNVCPDGMGWVNNPTQTLTENNQTVYEQVTLPGGKPSIRARVITTYAANFDTPATPATRTQPYEVRCSAVGIGPDEFQFNLRVAGLNDNGQLTATTTSLGSTPQSGNLSIVRTMEAKTTSFTPALNTLSRNVQTTVYTTHSTTIGSVQGQRLDFLRPSSLLQGTFTRVASLFLRSSDGAPCVQAGTTTRCQTSSSAALDAGIVRLHSIRRITTTGAIRFIFELLPNAPIGTMKISAAADATDLPEYLVDGEPQALDLLPWQATAQTVSVQ